MIVGAYSLDLYCDMETSEVPGGYSTPHEYGEFPHQFVTQTKRAAMREARARGWKFRHGKAICPKCAKRNKAKSDPEFESIDKATGDRALSELAELERKAALVEKLLAALKIALPFLVGISPFIPVHAAIIKAEKVAHGQ